MLGVGEEGAADAPPPRIGIDPQGLDAQRAAAALEHQDAEQPA